MIKIFLLLVFLFTINGYAQGPIEECFNYQKTQDFNKAIESGKIAVSLYPGNFYAYFCLGTAYFNKGELNLALENLKKGEAYARDKKELESIYNHYGMIYEKKRDLDNAFFYYTKSFNLAKELNNREDEANSLINLAHIHMYRKELDRALTYLEEAFKLTIEEDTKATIYNDIGYIYKDEGDFNKALNYFKKSIEIGEFLGNYYISGIAMMNLGDTYRMLKNWGKANYYLQEGLTRILRLENKYIEAEAYIYLSQYYHDIGDNDLAINYLTKANNLFKSIGLQEITLEELYNYRVKKLDNNKIMDNQNSYNMGILGIISFIIIIALLFIIYNEFKNQHNKSFENYGKDYNKSFNKPYQEKVNKEKRNNNSENESITWLKSGMKLYESRKYAEALISFIKTIDLGIKPELEGFLNYLIGLCFIKLHYYDKAIKALMVAITKGLSTIGKEADAWFLKGICYINLKEYEKAAMCLIKAIDLEIQHKFEALYMIGVIFIILERYGEAIQVLDLIIEFGVNKDKANCWYLKGLCLIKSGFQKEAEEAFNFSKRFGLNLELTPEINIQILVKGLKIYCQKIIDEFY